MRRRLISFLFLFGLGSMGCVFLLWGPGGILAPGPHRQDVIIVIKKGSNLTETARLLAQEGTIAAPRGFPWGFVAAVFLSGNKGALKAGEYRIPAHARPLDIVRVLVSGKVVVHQVTIPEGLMVSQVIEIINALPQLKGEIIRTPEEGSLLPETYSYVLEDSREKLVGQMRRAMSRTMEEVWQSRSKDFPLQTPEQLLILASIVEKETALPAERPRVAAVFLNRLKKGMKLQSDPTVAYGLTSGEKPLGRLLTLKDLKHASLYNTYVIPGLPPKPIACPGRKALEAVINPASTNEYYFVANGTGGHTFSSTYTGHAQNVKEWRKSQKERKP